MVKFKTQKRNWSSLKRIAFSSFMRYSLPKQRDNLWIETSNFRRSLIYYRRFIVIICLLLLCSYLIAFYLHCVVCSIIRRRCKRVHHFDSVSKGLLWSFYNLRTMFQHAELRFAMTVTVGWKEEKRKPGG